MQKGINYFTFLATDILGTGVTNISAGDLPLFGSINADPISLYTSNITEESNGYYTLEINLDTIGQGYFGITPAVSGIYITPDFWDVSLENNDADSLYSLFLSLQQSGTVDSVENFVEVNTNPFKESDDITLSYIISDDITPTLTGWTNYKAELRTAECLTSDTSASYLGLGSITIVDELTNSVTIDISGALTTGTVPEGSNTTNLYMDLQAINPSGKKKTLIEFTIPIVREITYN